MLNPGDSVYLAGPMRGYPQHNFPAFHAAAVHLRNQGYVVQSPAEMDEAEGWDVSQPVTSSFLAEACERDVKAILSSDAVVLLPGHESSRGATAEMWVAFQNNMSCYTYPNLKEIPCPLTSYAM